MLSKIRDLKNKKGFTLVELIVVLVILAILAALLIPALTGYIDKANKEKVISETRMVVMAAQTEISEAYGKADGGKLTATTLTNTTDATFSAIKDLSEAPGTINKIVFNADGEVTEVSYTSNGWTCDYTKDGGYGEPSKGNGTSSST